MMVLYKTKKNYSCPNFDFGMRKEFLGSVLRAWKMRYRLRGRVHDIPGLIKIATRPYGLVLNIDMHCSKKTTSMPRWQGRERQPQLRSRERRELR